MFVPGAAANAAPGNTLPVDGTGRSPRLHLHPQAVATDGEEARYRWVGEAGGN
jgi:hypothetical protein